MCITAFAISKLAALIRASASTHSADPRLGPRRAPGSLRLRDRREQRVEVDLGVGDAEVDAVGRALAADGADRSGQLDRERLVQQRVERALAGFRRALAVHLRARGFGIRRPVAALGDGRERAVERRAMLVEQGVAH